MKFNSIPKQAAVLGALGVGLAAAGQPNPPRDVPAPAAGAPVKLAFQTDKKVYGPKDPVKLTLTVKCPARSPVKLTFNSGMKYDFEIWKGRPAAGQKLWQWSRGRMFFQMVNSTTVDPAKPLVYTETFTPGEKGADGKVIDSLEPGQYTAAATLALSGRAPRPTASVAFTVR